MAAVETIAIITLGLGAIHGILRATKREKANERIKAVEPPVVKPVAKSPSKPDKVEGKLTTAQAKAIARWFNRTYLS